MIFVQPSGEKSESRRCNRNMSIHRVLLSNRHLFRTGAVGRIDYMTLYKHWLLILRDRSCTNGLLQVHP